MANDIETAAQAEVEAAAVTAAPAAKTRKELKKERKEIKKHKKQVEKEARLHSAKATKFNKFLNVAVSLLVIFSMLFCSITAIKVSQTIGQAPAAENSGSQTPSNDTQTPANNNTQTPSADTQTPSGDTQTPSGDTQAPAGDAQAPAAGDLSTKEGVVEYYKTAHAKVLSSAKSVTRIYDNTINYNQVLDIDGNTTLAGVAKSLMGTFMKENTEELVYTGADMKANFPAKNKGAAGLTADMVKEATAVDNGDTYTITIVIDSSEESPDLGDKSSNLVNTVDEKQVTDAAGSMVSLEGLENRYIAPKVIATVDKATGNITALDTTVPSYMCFAKASVVIISVANCRIGLEYQQKWTVQW